MVAGKKHTKLNNRSGFTLVELIVVIVITMILAGGITMGVVRWIRNMHFNEQEEYASVLYLSAQNQMAKYSAGGRLGELQSVLKQGKEDYPSAMRVPTEGSTESDRALCLIPTYAKENTERYLLKDLWPESVGKEHPGEYRDDICFIMGTKQAYELYQKSKSGQALSDEEKKVLTAPVRLLYDILLPYLYDPTILNASVCMEFAPSTGQIFSVLYSNDGQNLRMTYEKEDQYADKDGKAGNSGLEGVVSIFDRRYKERYKRNVGYYGVDSLTKMPTTNAKKPVVNKLKLNNEDTLNLSFQLSNILPASMGALDYRIEVLDYKSDVKRLDILFDGAQLAESRNLGTDVNCTVTRYDENGNELDTRTDYPITITGVDTAIVMYLDRADKNATGYAFDVARDVLNGADVASAPSNDEKTYALDFMNTYSFHRFGIDEKQFEITGNDFEDVYCAVTVSGAGYKEASRKKSNHENPYFAKKNQSGAGITGQIANGRHLYNIRFEEDAKPAPMGRALPQNTVYELINNIDWTTFALAEPNVDSTFASIKQLAQNSTFTSKKSLLGNENYTISGLIISEEKNAEAAVYGKVDMDNPVMEGPTGLFARNYGMINGVVLDRVQVNGTESVGAFCGENSGELKNLSVLNTDASSKVLGDSFVGGIFGQDKAAAQIEYSRLENKAKIQGRLYVGGITGRVDTTDREYDIRFVNCKNTGAISAKDDTARFLGGIIGLVYQEKGSIGLENCISSPQYSDDELKAMGLFQTAGEPEEADAEKLNKYLLGSFVGGIVGYNHDGSLVNCSTKTEAGNDGYVIGNRFVGGIVGLNESKNATAKLYGGANGVNEAHVFGDSYVGGIAGANAVLEESVLEANGDNKADIVPVVSRAVKNVEVEKWINRGIVSARSNYAGGIVGFNTGHIYECKNEVISKGITQSISKAQSMSGSFVGGIVGYNNGDVDSKSAKDVPTISYVTGKNYVGGIVGYNDFEARVAGYKLGGGSVQGSGAFVGGFAGLNASAELLDNQSLLSSPNQVVGKYFVGGSIGGNILTVGRDIIVELNTDNFLGNMEGEAFAGGIIGYNQFVTVKNADKSGGILELAEKLSVLSGANISDYSALPAAEKIDEDAFLAAGKNVTDEQKVLYYVLQEVNKLSAYDADSRTTVSPYKMTIKVIKSGSDLQNKLGGVTGKIYVGGVIGYNADSTGLYLQNIVNRTPITAGIAIPNAKESPSGDEKYKAFTYSYVGGVVGKVGRNTVVENCYNSEVGDVSGQGTYLGGVCEINEGQIINCAVSNIGFGTRDYVGGLVGLNKAGAKISGARFEQKSVIGGSFVGGIVSENYGDVELLVNKEENRIGKVAGASVRGQGYAVGGICAVNFGKLTMVNGSLEESDRRAEITVTGNGIDVGGIIGVNNGILKSHNSDNVKFTMEGTISGKMIAGGVVGENQNQTIENFVNKAFVSTVSGTSGGIAGISKGNIYSCENRGQVEAAKEGNAGGIVAKNEHIISACINRGEVNSKKGNCGGIAAENTKDGDIINCLVCGTKESPLEFVGYQNAGAVCAENAGTIRNLEGRSGAYVEYVIVTNSSDSKSKDCSIGLIAGVNTGKIGDDTGILVDNAQIIVETEGITAGGLVGANLGNGSVRQVTLESAVLSMSGFDRNGTTVAAQYKNCKVPYANMGGAVGINAKDALVENCAIRADIYGYKGFEDYAYGGLTAKNDGRLTGNTFNGSIICNGDAANNVIIGGFAGTNSASGVIEACYFGNEGDETVTYRIETGNSATGIIGGMIGENYGKLMNADHSDFQARVLITNQQGHTGGAVGFQHEEAVVSGSDKEHRLTTGPNWEILNKTYGNDTGVAGICGYSNSGEDIRFVANYAKVTGTNEYNAAAGGIMGRWENRLIPGATCYQLENYGEINGGLAGGIIGRVKYMYPQILECVNYGRICTISAKDNGYAGGIVASFHNSATKQVVISKCINYGEITEKSNTTISIGGIVGYAHDYSLRFVECSNLGNLIIKTKPTATNHNVAGILAKSNTKNFSIQFCTNYGNSNYSGFYGICAKSDQNSGAIANDFSAGAYVTYTGDGRVQKVVNNPVNKYTRFDNWNVFFMRPREIWMNDVEITYGSNGELIEPGRGTDKLNVISADRTTDNTLGVKFGKDPSEMSISFKFDTPVVPDNNELSYSAYNLSKMKVRFARPEVVKNLGDILKIVRVFNYKIRMTDGHGAEYWLGNTTAGTDHGWYGSPYPSQQDSEWLDVSQYAEENAHVFTTTLGLGEYFKDVTLDFTGGKTNIQVRKNNRGRLEVAAWNDCDWTDGISEISIVFTEIKPILGLIGDNENEVAIDYIEGITWDGMTSHIQLHTPTTEYVKQKVFPLRSEFCGDDWQTKQGDYDWKLKFDQTGKGVVNGQYWVHKMSDGSMVGVNHLTQNPERIWSDMSAIDPKNPEANIRYQVYSEINQNAVSYMKKFIDTVNGVKDLTFTYEDGNILLVNWNQTNTNPYYKDVLIYRIQNADGKTWGPYEEAIDIPAKLGTYYLPYKDEWVGRKIQVCVCSVNGSFEDSQLDAIIGNNTNQSGKTMANASVWVAKEDTIKRPLPIPVVHVELGAFDRNGNADPYKLVAILDNYEEFEQFYQDNAGDKSLVENVRIVVTFASGTSGTADERDIILSQGTRSAGFTTSADADTYMGAVAKDTKNIYAVSETANKEFSFVGTVTGSSTRTLTLNDMTITAFNDFYGDRTDNMYCELTLKMGDKRTEYYEFSDLVIKEWPIADDLQIDMVISQGITHVTHGSSDAIACRLSNLPKNIFEYDLQARTYLWYSQAQVMWFGHMVRTGIEEMDLADTLRDAGFVDAERGNTPVLSDGKLNPGYVVRKNADGTYDVYYSALLGNLDDTGKEIYEKQIDKKDYRTSERALVQKPVVDSFVLGENAQELDTYTFTWDQENAIYKTGSYALKFYGIKEETDTVSGKTVETEVLLDSRKVMGQGSITYVDENRLWEYEEVRLEVERIGSADGNNKTTTFPRFGEYTAKINLRHSQIAQPTVALNREGGVIEKESLKYKVTWIPIDASECDVVPAYEITVEPKADYVKNLGMVSHENYQKEVWNFIRVYADKAKDIRDLGTMDMVEDTGNISFEWDETGNDEEVYTVHKKAKIQYSYTDGVGKILVNLVEDWRFEQAAGTELSEAIIHLDDYVRGEVVAISVRAKGAKKNIGSGECVHRDSLPGVAREITLPNRLYAPKTEMLSLLTELAEKNQILGQYYNDTSVSLPIVPEIFTETQFRDAYFRLEYSDITEEDLQTAVHVAVDINDLPPVAENLSGNKAIISKTSETAMQGNFAQAEYRFGALAMKDYAGRYLRVALKGVSDSQISSLWSDEDSILENTMDYALFRLPKVKIDTPDVTEGDMMIYYDAQDDWHLTEEYGSRSAKQPTLSFKWDELAKEYVIKRIRRKVTDSYGDRTDVDVIHMVMDENGHIQVTCISSDASKEFYAGSWAKDFDSVNEIELPWSESVQIDGAGNRSVARMLLTYQEDNGTITVILPDALELSSMAGGALDANLLTERVFVQAIAGVENEEFFVDSQIATWKRNAGDRSNTTIGLTESFEEAPDTIPTANLNLSAQAGIAYELEVTDTANLYQITLKCADGNTAVRYLVPYQTLTGAKLLLTDELFAGFNPQLGEADNTISYKVARISENGVSTFTEESSAGLVLPKLTVPAGVLEDAVSDGMDLPGEYLVSGETEWKPIALEKQAVKLTPGSTEKISGYDISNGNGINVEIRFHKADAIWPQTGWYVGSKLIEETEMDVAELYGTIATTVSGNEGDTDKIFKTFVQVKRDNEGNLYVITPVTSVNGITTVETVDENTDYRCVYDLTFDVDLSLTTKPLNENYRVN